MTEDILEEALRLTSGDRQHQYGPPDQDFARTAKMWSALKGVEFEARDVAMFLICLKLSRETHQRKRDNSVDIAGYARCLHICNEAQSEEPQENPWPDFLPPPPALPEGKKKWRYLGKFENEEEDIDPRRCVFFLDSAQQWARTISLDGLFHHIESV